MKKVPEKSRYKKIRYKGVTQPELNEEQTFVAKRKRQFKMHPQQISIDKPVKSWYD